ncbi:MAG: pilus assembly FimT family protein [Burkholderiales bacterium]
MYRTDGAPIRAPRFFSPAACAGWTLIELTIVLVVGVIFAYFVVVRFYAPKEALALQQAERLRDDLRHAQMLAMNLGRSLQFRLGAPPAGCPGASYYVINCTVAALDPCTGAPNVAIVDPATGRNFCVTLESGLALAGANFHFDPLGRPKNGAAPAATANFDVTGGGVARRVTVTQLTGFVTSP